MKTPEQCKKCTNTEHDSRSGVLYCTLTAKNCCVKDSIAEVECVNQKTS